MEKLEERTLETITALDFRTTKTINALDERGEKRAQENRDLIQDKIGSMEKFIAAQIADNRNISVERFGELSGKLASLTTSFQGLSNDLFHAVGVLEGQVKGATAATVLPQKRVAPR
jgi:hypothetical protein